MRLSTAALIASTLLACSSNPSAPADAGDAGNNTPDGGDAGQICVPFDAGLTLPQPLAFAGVPSDAGLTPEDFVNDLALATCDFLTRCVPMASYLTSPCVGALLQGNPFIFEDQCNSGACGTISWPAGANLYQVDVLSVDAGLETFHLDEALKCLSAPFVCGQFAGYDTPYCGPVFTPNVAAGDPCIADTNCIGDGGPLTIGVCVDAGASPSCQVSPTALNPAPESCTVSVCDAGVCDAEFGVCRLQNSVVGAACANLLVPCAPGQYCVHSFGSTSSLGTCAAQAAVGQPCGGDFFTSGLALSNSCQDGNVCVGATLLPDGGTRLGTCQTYSDLGGPCIDPGATSPLITPSGCKSGLTCSCGVCVASPGPGQACAAEGTDCRPDLATCVNNVCEAN